MTVNASGQNYIDSLLTYRSWGGNTGAAQSVNYSFNVPSGDLGGIYGTPVPGAMQGAYLSAMQAWANVANINFVNTSYNISQIDFYRADLAPLSAGTLGVTLTYNLGGGSALDYELIALDDRYSTAASVAVGTTGYFAIMHEIGHALGLEHPGNYGQGENSPNLPSNEDNIQNSIMSYYNGTLVSQAGNPPRTPMIYDIAAIQYLYGANTSYNAGDNYYVYTGANITETIWDGSGADEILAWNAQSSVRIDLREGIDNYTQIGQSTIWIAFGADIERAGGGAGNDSIYGNDLQNLLVGNGGNDTVYGYESGDTLVGAYGIDYLYGGDGNDTLSGEYDADFSQGDAGNDFIVSWTGNDTNYGGAGDDSIYGNDDNDLSYGGDNNDSVYGQLGNDSVYGDAGNDLVMGHEGNDVMYGDSASESGTDGSDTMYGDIGDDSMVGGDGTLDEMFGGAGNDTMRGGSGTDGLSGDGNNDIIYGDAGNDFLDGGAGNDTLTGGTGDDLFMFFGTSTGVDQIIDFEGEGSVGGDRIYLGGTGFSNFASLSINYAGSTATIDLGGGNIITVGSVSTPLVSGDFTFA